MRHLTTLLAWVAPDELFPPDPEVRLRARSVVVALLALIVVCFVDTVVQIALGNVLFISLNAGGVVAALLTLGALRITRSPGLAASLIGMMATVLLGVAILSDGGIFSPGIIYLLVIPPLMYALGGPTHAWLAVLGLLGGLATLFWGADALDPYIGEADPAANGPMVVLNFVTTSAVILALLWLRERAWRSALASAGEHERARIAAQAESRSKSMVLASMSHEIRTPLNGVLGTAEILRGSDLSAEDRHHVRVIAESGRVLLSILNDILDSAKADAGQLTIQEEPVDPHYLADAVIRLYRGRAMTRGIELHATTGELPEALLADGQRLQQVLLNLVGNAVKFTERGEVVLHQEVRGEDWVLEVRDTGIGIAEDRLDAIFEPFVQADDATHRAYGGTGLGLSIVKQLVTLMGGTIGATSVEGQGSTFTVRLPARPARLPDLPSASHERPAERSLEVLVAEDNPVNRGIITTLLEREGHAVTAVENGALAVDICSEQAFDLVLMDVQMPELDGLQATRRLRSMPEHANLPIVGLSASAFADEVKRALDAGMDEYLTKPIDLKALRRVLASVAREDRLGA